MDKTLLTKSATLLLQVDQMAALEYADKSELLISRINKKILERADVEMLVGKNNKDMMKDNHANHVRFMASIFHHKNPDVLVETILWVFRAYRSHGFSSSYWAAQLNAWIEILKEELSPKSADEILPYYIWMQTNIPVFENLAQQKPDNPYISK